MRLPKSITDWADGVINARAADVTEPIPVKAPSGTGKVIPSYLGKAKGSTIPDSATNITNLDLSTFARNDQTMAEVIKKLVLSNPDLSHAVESKIKTAITNNYKVVAYDPTGRIDEAATETVHAFLLRMNNGSYDYSRFTRSTDIRSLAASMLFDSSRYGSMCAELILDASRLPSLVRPVSARLLKWADNTPMTYPIYVGPDGEVPLNFPTIFYSSTTQDNETAYSESPLQAAIQVCLWDNDFIKDLRRAATKNLMQRLSITINTDKFMDTLPSDVKLDVKKVTEHMNKLRTDLEEQMSNLAVDDTLVLFDILSPDTLADANRSEDRSIKVLQDLINGKVASGAKILPSMIGRGESSNAASTESMLFLKSVNSMQGEFNILFSRLLTLSLRLFGHDVYVDFSMEEINLRPGLELESFKAMKQSNTFSLLSYGFITDLQASVILTGKLPPDGFKPLSGTGFYSAPAATSGNDYSNTSVSPDGKPDSTQSQKDSEARS